MNNKYFATEVDVNHETQTFSIRWGDGHTSNYPLEGLRLACPCVECAGGHEFMGRPFDPRIFTIEATKVWRIVRLQEIGNYAVQIFWEDGHDSGIYTWTYLRDICPCEACRENGADEKLA